MNINTSPNTPEEARAYLTQFMDDAKEVLHHLEDQHVNYLQKTSNIYTNATQELKRIEDKLAAQLKSSLSKKQIANFTAQLKKAEKEIAKVIQRTQINVAIELAGVEDNVEMGKKIEMVARGGWKASALKLLALVDKTHKIAFDHSIHAKELMEKAHRKDIIYPHSTFETILDEEKHAQFQGFRQDLNDLTRRAGIIGINGVYRIAVTFSKKNIRKMVKSYTAQKMSDKPRTKIEKDIDIPSFGAAKSLLIPLNKEFDENKNLQIFGNIIGEKGISSLNRQEAHLVNALESNLSIHDILVYRSLRHGIISDKYETDLEIRKANTQNAAHELLIAAVMQEIDDLTKMGLSWEEIIKKGIEINLNSVSLVTPDDITTIGTGGANEKSMLADQIEALHNLEKNPPQFLIKDSSPKATTSTRKLIMGPPKKDFSGSVLNIKVHVNTFNFGVNFGAVDFRLGTRNQYEQNLSAFEDLKKQVEVLKESIVIAKIDRNNLDNLMKDIDELMATPSAYLQSDNQYEVGAKIINLTNLMNKIKGSGYKCAFNCKSGKDRTGFMDAIAKTFAIMAVGNGHYPTHDELQNSVAIRDQFKEILLTILLESGNLEITEMNSGARGYKISKHALVGGLSEEHFLHLLGLSKFTSR